MGKGYYVLGTVLCILHESGTYYQLAVITFVVHLRKRRLRDPDQLSQDAQASKQQRHRVCLTDVPDNPAYVLSFRSPLT